MLEPQTKAVMVQSLNMESQTQRLHLAREPVNIFSCTHDTNLISIIYAWGLKCDTWFKNWTSSKKRESNSCWVVKSSIVTSLTTHKLHNLHPQSKPMVAYKFTRYHQLWRLFKGHRVHGCLPFMPKITHRLSIMLFHYTSSSKSSTRQNSHNMRTFPWRRPPKRGLHQHNRWTMTNFDYEEWSDKHVDDSKKIDPLSHYCRMQCACIWTPPSPKPSPLKLHFNMSNMNSTL